MIKILISFVLIAFFAACSTPQGRAKAEVDLMESLTPEERELVKAGEVDLGFTEEMVRVALGDPNRIYSERTAERESIVWAYHARTGPRFSVGVGTSIGSGGRGTAYGGGVSVGTGGRQRTEERMRVVFQEGRVTAIERAER